MLSPTRRRELGAFYTPVDVADRLVAIALDGVRGAPLVCDPSCGDGVFLLAAARALAARGIARDRIARDLLWGIDVDAGAVDAARAAIAEWAGVSPGHHVMVGDGLADDGWSGRFDVVVGNPPFLNQLERVTVRERATRWSAAAGPYADTAFLFLLAALDRVRPGGRVVLVQPQSLAAARDASAIRDAVLSDGALIGMWTCNQLVFDANARVCAPVIVRDAQQPDHVARWGERGVDATTPARWERGPTWSRFLVRRDEAPPVTLDGPDRLGQIVSATAGFREQFYGLVPYVIDREDADDRAFPRLITCGGIDLGRCAWGERSLRFARMRWQHPRVDLAAMADGPLRRWVVDRLVPKVVLATQTKVLEPAIDADGTWVPSTPVIAVHAPSDVLFRVAAVLLSPPVSAWASSMYAGVALTSDAIKLSARQVLEIPLPPNEAAWERGAEALAAGELLEVGSLMTTAYGCDDGVTRWWANRWQPS
jgi:N-6 DNA methylase